MHDHDHDHVDPRIANAERPVLRAEDCGASPAATTSVSWTTSAWSCTAAAR